MKSVFFQILCLMWVFQSVPFPVSAQYPPGYKAENGAIIGLSTGRYNNRPLYINHSNAFVLTGDQPVALLAKGEFLFGTFMVAMEREGRIKWLQHCHKIRSIYTPGSMKWEVADNEFPGLKVILEIVPSKSYTGMSIKATAESALPEDQLVWAFGGAKWYRKQNLSWKMDVMGHPEWLSREFDPDDCKDNQVGLGKDVCYVGLDDPENQQRLFTVTGKCSRASTMEKADASDWSEKKRFLRFKEGDYPVVTGNVRLERNRPVFWTFKADVGTAFPVLSGMDAQALFEEGKRHTDGNSARLRIHTPDPFLDAIAGASVAAVDGTWYPPVFVHGAMQWNSRFPGWRTIFGGIMLGWHDRVIQEAKFYTDSQVKVSDKREAKADPSTLLAEQHPDSRFYGTGRIGLDQKFYDMQSQFFDQIVEEYRWTNDTGLVAFFREALELHLEWMRECFDPDGDGVYESYINTWPSDSQWYNGGGSAEETSYAYRGHWAARDMARNAGDREAEKFHTQMMEKIRNGFFSSLWIQNKGHSGAYREQGGHERLHEDPWLYSIFLPIDAGLTTPVQSVESVYYSEWALQNDRFPYGGRQVWTSNWIPGIWSVRELWPGDNYHLALSYFQTGLAEDGYDVFRGTFLRTAFNHLSPGNLGGVQGGLDFGDCVHPFTRTLVSGLFGYRPDYPNRRVLIAPQFPSEWKGASFEIPDFGISFSQQLNRIHYSVKVARKANLELRLPVQFKKIKNVKVNGRQVKWKLLPGFGRSIVAIDLPDAEKAEVIIETGKSLAYASPVFIEGNTGDEVTLSADDAVIISLEDPQNVLENVTIRNGIINATLTSNKGFHTVVAEVVAGDVPQYRVFRMKINDPAGEASEAGRVLHEVPGKVTWENIDISDLWNADVTTIYQQKYLSPRPHTVSLRMGTDGYSPWTFPHWNSLPPPIRLDRIQNLTNGSGRLLTPQGVPFIWPSGEKNIAFTSLWDNYPSKIEFPVGKSGDAVWFLVAGSTNIMQCRIANAVIRLNYADGSKDSLELIPPVNYWNLSTIDSHATAPGQAGRNDYTSEIDRFCLPVKLPETVQLGEDCRAMLLNLKMPENGILKSVTLETLSQEVVVGLMGISVMKMPPEK